MQGGSASLIDIKQTAAPNSWISLAALRSFRLIKRSWCFGFPTTGVLSPDASGPKLVSSVLPDVKAINASAWQFDTETNTKARKRLMHSFNQTPLGPVRSGSGQPADGQHNTAAAALSSVQDWVMLCQRCAGSEPQSETRHRPGAEQPRCAVIIPLKSRHEP